MISKVVTVNILYYIILGRYDIKGSHSQYIILYLEDMISKVVTVNILYYIIVGRYNIEGSHSQYIIL